MLPAQQGCEAMDKSEDAFRTISEAAEELDLPQHVLRFWETRFPQIRPLKRGGGRRYYRPDDVELLRVIRHLLYSDGYTIKGVQRMLKERGVRAVLEVRNEAAAAPTRASEAAPAQPESAQLALSPEPPRTHGSVATAPSGIILERPFAGQAATSDAAEAGQHAASSAAAGSAMPAPSAASMPRVRPALSAQDRSTLEAIVAELAECRRILGAANI